MTPFTCRSTIAHHQVLWGNGYGEIEKNGKGESMGLWPLLPDRTRPMRDTQTKELYYTTSIDGQSFDIENENCLHIPALAWDGYIGYSPVAQARQAFGLSLATEEFGAKFFGNDAKSGGFLMHPAKLGEKAAGNLSDSMNKKGDGLKDAHRIRILEEGMKFVQTTIPPDDAQFLATREFQIAEIARMFGVPLFLLQSTEKSTSWGSGIESMGLAFLMWTLNPWIIKMEQEVNRKMFTTAEREKGLFVKLNVNALLRGDMAARATFYKNGIVDGWMTRNEVRNLEDRNPLEGLDEPLVPLNMTPAGQQESQGPGIKTPPEDDE
jgi:HK97 family phage portal protein